MKSFAFFCVAWICFAVFPDAAHAAVTPDDPGNFITTWNTENPGTSNNTQITIPGDGGGYSYEIYWEDTASSTINGTTSLITSSSYTLTFPAPGIYEVQASGSLPRIYFNDSGDEEKILTVEQWGDIAWTSMFRAFRGATNLRVPATDAPDLSGVTTMFDMFSGASSFNEPINHWDVSNVTRMESIFQGASMFNQPLDNWNVSNVTRLERAFRGAVAFNQPLDNWDVSSVTNFRDTFVGAHSFNQPLNSWNVASATSMQNMFSDAISFDQPLDNWDVSNVNNFQRMFGASFNQPDGTPFSQDISVWDTSSATNMQQMFQRNTQFNYSLAAWDVSSVTSMDGMFFNTGLSTANQNTTLQSWSQQTLQSDVNLHLGQKSYTDIGATALATMRDTYGWTIEEQYTARYNSSPDAILTGTSLQPNLTTSATTTPVNITPDNGCTFERWSDGRTDNPRSDTITDNLVVTAELECRSTTGTSLRTQRERATPDRQAELEDRFGTNPDKTFTETLEEVKTLPDRIDNILANTTSSDQDTARELLRLLLALVAALLEVLAQSPETQN